MARIQECATNFLADVSNVSMHILHPMTQHDHGCFCLLCVGSLKSSSRTLNLNTVATLSVIPKPTTSDLELLSTGSPAIREVLVFSNDDDGKIISPFLMELKTHLHYEIAYKYKPKIFHVLVLVFLNQDDWKQFEQQTELIAMISAKTTNRVVIIAPLVLTIEIEFLFSNLTKLTCLYYGCAETFFQVLLHAMMVTKQRLMPKTLLPFIRHNECLITTSQQGVCLFL